MKVIGHYRYVWASCVWWLGPKRYTTKPVYGERQGPHGIQVLVDGIGGLNWINPGPGNYARNHETATLEHWSAQDNP